MAGERLKAGEIHFAVTMKDRARFKEDAVVDDVDRHGAAIKGKVLRVLEGSDVALIVIQDGGGNV